MDWGGCHPQNVSDGKTKNKANTIDRWLISTASEFFLPLLLLANYAKSIRTRHSTLSSSNRCSLGDNDNNVTAMTTKDNDNDNVHMTNQCKCFEWKTIKSPNNNHLNTETEKIRRRRQHPFKFQKSNELKHAAKVTGLRKARWARCVLSQWVFDYDDSIVIFFELIVYAVKIICWKKIRHKSNTLLPN